MSFIEKICMVDKMQSDMLIAIALLMGTPFFLVFGALSDKIGRKKIMLAGMLLAMFAYRPIYEKMYQTVSVKHKTEIAAKHTETVTFVLNPKTGLKDSVYNNTYYYTDQTVKTETKTIQLLKKQGKLTIAKEEVKTSITINSGDKWILIWMVFFQVIFVTMVYGPIAAFLVEMFPTNIRYTSMSLPYHIGNGVFGGLLPAVATYLASKANDANAVAEKAGTSIPFNKPYLEGLWYPIIVSGVCFVIGMVYINGKKKHIE
jgi:MFS family permease